MEIRFARPEDTTGILELLRQIGQIHYQARPDLFQSCAQKFGASQVLAMLTNDHTPVFVAAEGQRIRGYAFCKVKTFQDDPVMADHTTLYLEDLCVDESCRGHEIGTALFNHIRRYAREQKCRSITLNVWTCNPAAIRFYEKMGCVPQKIGMEQLLEGKYA